MADSKLAALADAIEEEYRTDIDASRVVEIEIGPRNVKAIVAALRFVADVRDQCTPDGTNDHAVRNEDRELYLFMLEKRAREIEEMLS